MDEQPDRAVEERPAKRRRQSLPAPAFRTQSVGIAVSIGFPMMMVGMLILFVAYSAGGTFLWALGGGLAGIGLIVSSSGRVL